MNNETLIIENKNINFFLEEVPIGLSTIDRIRVKRMYQQSISGYIIKSYYIRKYIIFIYTDIAVYKKNICCVLFEKIQFLQQLLNVDISNEIWIVKDKNYTCIGMLEGVPIFIREFEDVYSVDTNLEMIYKSMSEYSQLSNIQYRLFGCLIDDFQYSLVRACEYPESMLMEFTNGKTLGDFCIENFHKRSIYTAIPLHFMILAVSVMYFVLCIFVKYKMMEHISNDLATILILSKEQMLSFDAYLNLIKYMTMLNA